MIPEGPRAREFKSLPRSNMYKCALCSRELASVISLRVFDNRTFKWMWVDLCNSCRNKVINDDRKIDSKELFAEWVTIDRDKDS